MVESFIVRRQLEPFPCREDGDVRHAVATFTRAIPPDGDLRVGREEVAGDVGAEAPRDADERRPIGCARIRVIDDNRPARAEGFRNQLLLATLRLSVVAHHVLADKVMRASKTFAIESRLA